MYLTKIYNKESQTEIRRSLRNNMSPIEVILWSRLKGKQIDGLKFRRQFGVGPYIVDFYCPQLKLAIEIDGESHYQGNAQEYDSERQKVIESYGIRFLRFSNKDVLNSIEGVIQRILHTVEEMKSMD